MAYLGKWAELHLLDDHHKGHKRRNKKGCISKSYYLFAEIVEHRVDIFFSKTWCPLRHHQYGSSLHWHEARIINFYIFSIRLRAYMLSRLVLNVGSIALKEKENSLPNTQKKKLFNGGSNTPIISLGFPSLFTILITALAKATKFICSFLHLQPLAFFFFALMQLCL